MTARSCVSWKSFSFYTRFSFLDVHLEFNVAFQFTEVLELARMHRAVGWVLSQFRQFSLIAADHQLMLPDLLSLHRYIMLLSQLMSCR